MAETTQFTFELSEVATALIKQQGLHDGLWTIGCEFGFAAALAGPTQGDVRPAAFVTINKIQLMRQPPGAPVTPFTVYASEVNPPPATSKRPPRTSAKPSK
jgi:hypothetical protein